jgi:hypothetical protein
MRRDFHFRCNLKWEMTLISFSWVARIHRLLSIYLHLGARSLAQYLFFFLFTLSFVLTSIHVVVMLLLMSIIIAVYSTAFVVICAAVMLLESFFMRDLIMIVVAVYMLMISLRVFIEVNVVLWAWEVRATRCFFLNEYAASRRRIRLKMKRERERERIMGFFQQALHCEARHGLREREWKTL